MTIRHVVLVRYRPDVDAATRAAILADLDALRTRLPGMTGFEGGPNVSPEGLGKGFDDGFVVTFDDAASRDAYLADDRHREIGGRIVAAAEGGVDGVLVFDLKV